MKKTVNLLLVALLIVALIPIGANALTLELIKNGGFDDSDMSMWSSYNGGVYKQVEGGKNGTTSCEVTRTNQYGSVKQDITRLVNHCGKGRYNISISAKIGSASAVTTDKLTSYIRGTANGADKIYPISDTINKDAYKTISWYVDVKVDFTNAFFSFQTENLSTPLLIDDISITFSGATPPPPEKTKAELLYNGGFEDAQMGMWQNYNGGVLKRVAGGKTGGYACEISRINQYGAIKQDITRAFKIYGKGTYTVSMSAKIGETSTVDTDRITFYIRGTTSAGEKIITEYLYINKTDFTSVTIPLMVNYDFTDVFIGFQTDKVSTPLIVDDISIKKETDFPMEKTWNNNELIFNGDFEGNTTSGWMSTCKGIKISNDSKNGKYACELTRDGKYQAMKQELKENGKGIYRLTMSVKISDSSPVKNDKIILFIRNKTDTFATNNIDISTNYTTITRDLNVTKDIIDAFFSFQTSDVSTPLIVDDVSIKFISKVDPIEPVASDLAYRPQNPVVGVIRWDAWIGDLSPVGVTVENVLSNPKYQDRLPFYAKILENNKVQIRATTQDIIDKEILYASDAGLDYFAYCWYGNKDYMSTARKLHLTSAYKNKMKWCSILGTNSLDYKEDLPLLIEQMKDDSYQKVQNGRPLLYYFAAEKANVSLINILKEKIIAAGLPSPYIVAMGSDTSVAYCAARIGADAISSYATSGKNGITYKALNEKENQKWLDYKYTTKNTIPNVTVGWDKRPRAETPVSWENPSSMSDYVQKATPTEIAEQLKNAMDWNNANKSVNPTNLVLMYGWNEFDEGGWLCPTISDGTARLDAIKALIAPSFTIDSVKYFSGDTQITDLNTVNGDVTVKCILNSALKYTLTPTFIVALYDGDKIISLNTETTKSFASGAKEEIISQFTIPQKSGNYTLKIMCWDVGDIMKPFEKNYITTITIAT